MDERKEIIRNAENAYKRGEVSSEFLGWYRVYTAKECLTVKLMYCPACGIDTNHHLTKSGDLWVCWCGCAVKG